MSKYISLTGLGTFLTNMKAWCNGIFAKFNGYYSTLTAGAAENIVGRGSVSAEFLRRTTGGTADVGSGAAQVKKVKGNTIVWNQLLTNGNLINGTTGWSWYYGDASIVDGKLQYVVTSANNSAGVRYRRTVINGHKYYFSAIAYGSRQQIVWLGFDSDFQVTGITLPTAESRLSAIITSLRDGYTSLGIRLISSQVDDELYVKSYCLIDLTQMFGAGNEPSTAEEFEAMFPLDYYDYNAGTLLSMNATKLRTIGFNQLNSTTGKFYAFAQQYQISGTYTGITQDGEAITPDANGIFTPAEGEVTVTGFDSTTCVHLVWSGIRNGESETFWQSDLDLNIPTMKSGGTAIFPDGLRSAGSAYDEIVVDADGVARKAIKRIGKVDLGSLTWRYSKDASQTNGAFYSNSLTDIVQGLGGLVCANYAPTSGSFVFNNVDSYPDKIIGKNASGGASIYIKDINAGTDAAAFKTAMSGIYLYYELDTPVEYTLDTPLEMNYREDDFGTEQILPENTSAPTTSPFICDIQYPMNAADTLRNLPKNYAGIAASGTASSIGNLLAAMQTAGIIAGYTITYDSTNGRYNFTVTAPEASE